MDFKVGDVVYTKIGGPKLIITEILHNFATVRWITSAMMDAHFDETKFPLDCLTKENPYPSFVPSIKE